jgi:hypothetical protein
VGLRAQGLADRGCYRYKFGGELMDCLAEPGAATCPRGQRPQALDGPVAPIGQDAADPLGRLLLGRGTWPPLGLRKGRRTRLLGVAEMPEHAPTDKGRQLAFVCQTFAVFLLGEDIDGPRQPTPGQDRYQPGGAERTAQARAGQW